MFKRLCQLILCAFVLTVMPGFAADSDCRFPTSEVFEQYVENVERICNQNRECYFPLLKTVRVRFFLMEDGIVRDPRILVSSGLLSHDLSCIDAVLSSSPLPIPPAHRKPLPPPGVSTEIDVATLPSGPMEVVFHPNAKLNYRLREWDNPRRLAVPIIPLRIAETYPALFDKQTLLKPDNFFEPDPPGTETFTTAQLESLRFPWTELYRSNAPVTKTRILSQLDIIQKYFAPVSYDTKWRGRWESTKSVETKP